MIAKKHYSLTPLARIDVLVCDSRVVLRPASTRVVAAFDAIYLCTPLRSNELPSGE